MKEGKPFFFRIDLIELMDFATEPEGQGMSLLQFAKELKRGQSGHKSIQKIIDEAYNYIEKKKKAGSSGGKAKASSAKALLNSDIAEPSRPLARSSNRSSSNTEPEPIQNANNLSASDDAVSADDEWISRKKRRLEGKRLETFKDFWEAFDYKRGRAEAIDAWIDIPQLTNALSAKIVEAARVEAKNRATAIQSGKTPKMAQGWISGRRWEDDLPQKKEDLPF